MAIRRHRLTFAFGGIVRADIDEVPPFRLELEVIGFGGATEMPASWLGITNMSRRRRATAGMPRTVRALTVMRKPEQKG